MAELNSKQVASILEVAANFRTIGVYPVMCAEGGQSPYIGQSDSKENALKMARRRWPSLRHATVRACPKTRRKFYEVR